MNGLPHAAPKATEAAAPEAAEAATAAPRRIAHANTRLHGDARGRDRVVLIGDAAHASSPMMGQGGGMAVEDAYVLADCLRSAHTVEAALDRYVTRRKPRVRWVQQESLAVSQIIGLPSEPRDAALRTRGKEMFRHRFQPLIASP